MDPKDNVDAKQYVFGSNIISSNKKRKTLLIAGALLLTVLIVITSILYFSKLKSPTGASSSVEEISKDIALVEITADGIIPATIGVKAGVEVKFVNRDAVAHRLMADPTVLQEFDSIIRLSAGDSYTYVFDTPGTYSYYDSEDPVKIHGTVEVRAP